MNQHTPRKPHHSPSEEDEPQPGPLPVEPDEGDTPVGPAEDAGDVSERGPAT